MYWKITKDHLVDGTYITKSRVGTHLPSRKHVYNDQLLKVRLLDDDRELYYEAVSDDEALEDLYNWAMTDAGCTILQVEKDGKWVDELA